MADTTIKVMRRNLRDFIQEKTSGADLLFCGIGFTQFDEASGAQVESPAYIPDTNTSPYIKSYSRTFAYAADVHVGSEVAAIALLQKASRNSLVGSDAELYYYRTDPNFVEGEESLTNIPCRKITVSNENAGSTGDALDAVKTSGTLHQVGDATEGYLTISDGTYTFSEEIVTEEEQEAVV